MIEKLILDFDGYAENISPENYLSTTDNLHNIISEEFFNTLDVQRESEVVKNLFVACFTCSRTLH